MTKKDKPSIVEVPAPAAGFGPRRSLLGLDDADHDDDEDMDIDMSDEDGDDIEAAQEEYLYDYAMEYLPRLPQLDRLLEGVSLDYSVLVSARIAVEALADHIPAADLDDLLCALLLAAEGDENAMTAMYEKLDAGAQQNLMDLQDISSAETLEDITGATAAARTMLLAGAIADIEVLDELMEEDEETATFEELETTGGIMVALSEQGGITDGLLARAAASFNLVARKSNIALELHHEDGVLRLNDLSPPAPNRRPPNPKK